jgi:hypothetical protein
MDVVDWLADPGCACCLDEAGDEKASILKSIDTIIDTRQKTPLLVMPCPSGSGIDRSPSSDLLAGMNAAEWLCSVMFYSLDIPFDKFAAHFSRGPDIVTP